MATTKSAGTGETPSLGPEASTATKPQKVVHLSREERAAKGKAARAAMPLTAMADLQPAADRDPVALLEEQAAARVPDLVPIRYGRMLTSPFAFYRGGALLMAVDLGATYGRGLMLGRPASSPS